MLQSWRWDYEIRFEGKWRSKAHLPALLLFLLLLQPLLVDYKEMPGGAGGWDHRMNGEEVWRRNTASTGDGYRRRRDAQVSATELGMKLGNSIWRRSERGEDFQLADLFPWPKSRNGNLFICLLRKSLTLSIILGSTSGSRDENCESSIYQHIPSGPLLNQWWMLRWDTDGENLTFSFLFPWSVGSLLSIGKDCRWTAS